MEQNNQLESGFRINNLLLLESNFKRISNVSFNNPEKKCSECTGTNKDKPILGMLVINEMTEKKGTLTGGTILDPNNGKVYKCNISIDTATGNLNVRGSLDRGGLIGRTQTWLKN